MRNKILAAIIAVIAVGCCVWMEGCASFSRSCVDIKSNLEGGLNRTINIYTANGDLLATYNGKIDLAANDGGYVKFDLNGKRYIYYNGFVETIADIN